MSSHQTTPTPPVAADDLEATRQVTIAELGDELGRCEAIAEYTSERCKLPQVGGTPYCPFHIGDLAPIDEERETG